jgi:hypothetical protein
MIEKDSEIKELYDLKHINDHEIHTHYDYETNLITKMFPKYIYENDNMNNFLNHMKKQWIYMIESVLPIRNFFNFTVNKWYNKHSN